MKKSTARPPGPASVGLRRRAEVSLGKQRGGRSSQLATPQAATDPERLLHELQVHQLELEMQNAELLESRERTEALLEKYTDLYDFAPVGYFSLDPQGRILEVNLKGAAMLGAERSGLIRRSLLRSVTPADRPGFGAFLERVFARTDRQVCEATLLKDNGDLLWANFHGNYALSRGGAKKSCRVAVSDIAALKHAEEAERRLTAVAGANEELRSEIVRRQAVEEALRRSEQDLARSLDQSRHMQQQLRHLSHRILQVQEEERRRISRELHDQVTQTLVGISVQLDALVREPVIDPRDLKRKMARTQRLVEKSVRTVHEFARELRPALLDDLGLVATLQSLVKDFSGRTGIPVRFSSPAKVNRLNSDRQTVLYRVTQSALSNIIEHAEASEVSVRVRGIRRTVCLEVADNGKAFEVDKVLRATTNKRLGLIGMRERVEMVGGIFSIESVPGRGTTIRAQIPYGRGART